MVPYIDSLEQLIKSTCWKVRNLKLKLKGELAFSGVTSAGFAPIGLGVSRDSSGCVSTCPSGNTWSRTQIPITLPHYWYQAPPKDLQLVVLEEQEEICQDLEFEGLSSHSRDLPVISENTSYPHSIPVIFPLLRSWTYKKFDVEIIFLQWSC